MFDVFGFGQPLDHQPIMALPGVQAGTWGPVVEMVAAALGVELDEIRETYEREPTPRRLEVASGVIEAGTVGAVRMETIGVVDGRDAIVVEHVNRMARRPRAALADRRAGRHLPRRGRRRSRRCAATSWSAATPTTASADGHGGHDDAHRERDPRRVRCAAGLVSSLDLPLTLPRAALGPIARPSTSVPGAIYVGRGPEDTSVVRCARVVQRRTISSGPTTGRTELRGGDR